MYLRIAGFMTLAAIAAKLILFLTGVEQESMALLTICVNLIVVLFGSFFAVRHYKIGNPGSSIRAQVKYGMKATTFFALLLSMFVLIYYEYIDTHYLDNMIAERVELAKSQLETNPDINIDQVRNVGEMMFSPRTHATITLFGLTFIGALYTLIIAIILKKIPGFRSGTSSKDP